MGWPPGSGARRPGPDRRPVPRRPKGHAVRILVLNWLDRQNPRAGGAELHLHEVFGRLARRGHEVTLLASGFEGASPRTTLDGIEVRRTGGRHTYSVAAPLYHRRRLSDRAFDVVVEDLNKVPLFTPFWIETPLLLLVHHLFGATAFRQATFPVAAATWLLERPLANVYRGTPTVAVSESTARDLGERGMDIDRIRVVHNGVDVDRYRPDPEVPPFPEPTLLYLGRLKRYKRIDLILRATAVLKEWDVACRLLVAGEGDERPRLEELVDRLGLSDRVRFLGWVPEERKLELFRRAWLHVLTSEKEGWGISNLEAGACATPTVASDSPGLRDSVVDRETGLLVPHGDVESLALAIRGLLVDDGRRRALGAGARSFAEDHSWDAAAERFETLLREARDAD